MTEVATVIVLEPGGSKFGSSVLVTVNTFFELEYEFFASMKPSKPASNRAIIMEAIMASFLPFFI